MSKPTVYAFTGLVRELGAPKGSLLVIRAEGSMTHSVLIDVSGRAPKMLPRLIASGRLVPVSDSERPLE